MKLNIKVNGIIIPVELFVTVLDSDTLTVIDQGFDSFKEANTFYPRPHYDFRWTVSRVLDKSGNLDFPVYASSKLRAISNLKKALS